MKPVRILITACLLAVVAVVPALAAEGRWQRDARTGCSIWNKDPHPSDLVSWKGECAEHRASGEGTLTWEVSEEGKRVKWIYNGSMLDGMMHGKGKLTISGNSAMAGNSYEGEFFQSDWHGYGVFKWANGDKYEGNWVHDRRTGFAVFTSASGYRYEGDFFEGKEHGQGILIWSSGTKYNGTFVNGEMHGTGTLYRKNGRSGPAEFRRGKFVRWLD